MSSVRRLQQAAAGANGSDDSDVDASQLLSGVEVSQSGVAACMGKESSQQVMVASGPEVFDTPSGAGEMEDESVLLGETRSVRSSGVLGEKEKEKEEGKDESLGASTVQTAANMTSEEVAPQQYMPAEEAEEREANEASLSCIQNRILPLEADSRVEERADVGHHSAAADAKHLKGGDSALASAPDARTPHTSIAETVAHQSRPSTASTHVSPCAHASAPRPGTPGVLEAGWVGGRDGGAGGVAEDVFATAELGHVTPLNRAAMAMMAGSSASGAHGLGSPTHDSPSAGWQVAATSLKPARQADPNHPLRAGTTELDETVASVTQSVYCSTLDDTQATATTFGHGAAALPAVEAGERLRSSVGMALDLFNVARASGQRAAVADIVASLRASQDRISQALAAYDLDLSAALAPSSARADGSAHGGTDATEHQEPQAPVPASVAIHMLKTRAPGSVPPSTSSDMTPPNTTRRFVPPLSLPTTAHTAANTEWYDDGSREVARMMKGGAGEGGGGWGGWANAGWAHATPAASTALPSARSSMEYAGSNLNSHRNFENLSEISIASEGRTVVDVEEVLERYSERLLQMVSAKLKNSTSASIAPASVAAAASGDWAVD